MRGKNGKSKTNQGKEKLRQMETERLYQNSLHIFEEFKRRTFMSPNIRSIFLSSYNTYNLKGNLRFELAPESEENFQKRIEVAKDRAKLRVSDNLLINNKKTNTIVNIYDDRGCDIWSNNFQSQKKLYDKFNDWILKYDKNEIDLFYSNIDRV